jgi:phosphatidate cytidylyltransferase
VRERAISAAVLVPVVVVAFLLGMPWLGIGIAGLAVLAAIETGVLLGAAGFSTERVVLLVAPPLAVAGMAWTDAPEGLGTAFVGGVIVVAGIAAFARPDVRDGFSSWLATAFGALYASLLATLVGILTLAPAIPAEAPARGVFDPGRTWLLILLATVWGFDTFAYLSGRTFRRGRFMAHISPNKTWSGVIGGTAAAVVIGAVGCWVVGASPLVGLALGLVIAISAQSGDLAESMLKRAAGRKDSGALIPGHGGILDRTDSFLFAGPAMFAFLVLAGPLGILPA